MELNQNHVNGLLNGQLPEVITPMSGVGTLLVSGRGPLVKCSNIFVRPQVAKITMTVHNKVRKELVKPRNSNHTSSAGLQITSTFPKANMTLEKTPFFQDIMPH